MNPDCDVEYLYIAKQGLVEPVPQPWEVQQDSNENIIYYNPMTQEQSSEHPRDDYFKQLFLSEKSKRMQTNQLPQANQPSFLTPQTQTRVMPNLMFPQPHQYTPIISNNAQQFQNDSNIDFDDRNIVYQNQDFVTFNPPQGSFHHYQQYPNQQRDVSVNTSFQTDINNFINAVNLQFTQQIEKHMDKKNKELEKINGQAEENRLLMRREFQLHLQEQLEHFKMSMQHMGQQMLNDQQKYLELQKESKIGHDQEYITKEINSEKDRVRRRFEAKLREEREQLETLNSLEIQRVKFEQQSKLSLQKSKIQMQIQEMSELSYEEREQLKEIESFRLQLEDQLERLGDQLQADYRDQKTDFRQELIDYKEKVQQKEQKEYSVKLQEDRFYFQQKQSDMKQKKEQYMEELRQKQQDRVKLEKEKIDLELKELMRDAKTVVNKKYDSKKEEIKLKNELQYTKDENQIKLEYYRKIRENQQEKQDKYKLIKEGEYKWQKVEIDKQYHEMIENVANQYNNDSIELSQYQTIVKQIEVLKQNIRDLRQQKTRLDDDVEHSQLIRQKISIKVEQLKKEVRDKVADSGNKQDKDLEQAFKMKEAELESLNQDINRIRAFQIIRSQGGENDDEHVKDIEQIKMIIADAVKEQKITGYQEQDYGAELEELKQIIPIELAKIEEKVQRLDQEREKLEQLIIMINQDLLSGIEVSNQKEMGTKAYGIMTEFKVNLEKEKQKLNQHINKILQQTSQLKDSQRMLQKLRKQVDVSRKLMSSPSQKDQLQGESEKIRNDFKHYLRKMWLIKQEEKGKQGEEGLILGKKKMDEAFLKELSFPDSSNYRRKRIADRGKVSGASQDSSKYSGIIHKHSEWMSKNLRSLTLA